ncbi:hypothetical protein [Nitrosopumilus sp.]|uniref:hypothetical protein n=1 Tax=Nitrosopumilus sp. TaxID=2024843 RepID=UPI00247F1455|nr:hypothetical protein [Nitrosopumilus sp.]MCV0409385.1 hypothetical protein [Nitrosopumilus sp.]
MSFEDRITRIALKFLDVDNSSSEGEMQLPSDDTIHNIIHYLICLKEGYPHPNYSRNELTFEILKLKKCDLSQAKLILMKMDSLGLEICGIPGFQKHSPLDGTRIYEIIRFAEMRGYVNDEEIKDFEKRKSACDKELADYASKLSP